MRSRFASLRAAARALPVVFFAACGGGGAEPQDRCRDVTCDAGQACNPATGRCESVGCATDADCAGTATPRCRPAVGQCVQCLEDADCTGATPTCDAAAGTCVAAPPGCGRDADCTSPDAPACNTATRECVACTMDAHCPAPGCQECDANQCRTIPDACCDDDDCSGTRPHCDSGDHVCVECLAAADCDACETCNDNGACVTRDGACCNDADCPTARPHCDDDDDACVECSGDADCDASCESCDVASGTCRTIEGACCEDADCGPGAVCDPDARVCVGCLRDADCRSGCETCDLARNVCTRVPEACCADADCTDPTVPRCHPDTHRCATCVADGDCRDSCEVCSPASGQCELAGPRACCDVADCAGVPGAITCDAGTNRCTGCTADADCGTQRCLDGVCAACTASADCPPGAACDAATHRCGAPAGCTSAAQCGLPLFCDAVRGACVDCLQDRDCGPGQTCDRALGSCREPNTCGRNANCGDGRICADDKCVDAGCVDDRYEPNDGALAATLLGAGTTTLQLCPNDDDVFQVIAAIGDGLIVTVVVVAAAVDAADIELLLVLPTGETRPATVDGNTLRIVRPRLAPAEVQDGRVSFALRSAGGYGAYDLTVERFPGGVCFDDAAEPDDDAASARAVASGAAVTGVLCGQDEDWARFDVSAGNGLDVAVTFDPIDVDIDLEVLELLPDGSTSPVAASATQEGVEHVTVPPGLADAVYVARVFSVLGAPTVGASYTLEATIAPPPPANDTCAAPTGMVFAGDPPSATATGTTVLAGLDVAPSCAATAAHDVVYTFTLTQPASAAIELAFAGTTDAALYVRRGACDGAQSEEIACVNENAAATRLDFPRLLPALYFVFVAVPAGQQGPFELTVTLGEAGPSTGDTCADPQPITLDAAGAATVSGNTTGLTDDLSACVGSGSPDQVWQLVLPQTSRLTVTLDDAGSHDSGLYVRGGTCANGGPADLWCQDDPEPQTRTLTVDAGTLWIIVDGYRGAAGAYRLSVLAEPIMPATNTTCASAQELVFDPATGEAPRVVASRTGAGDDLTASCGAGGSDVVFAFDVPDDRSVRIQLDTEGSFVPVADVRSSDCDAGAVVLCREGTGAAPLDLRYNAPPGRSYLVVDGAGDAGHYAVTVSLAPPLPPGDTCDEALEVTFDGDNRAVVAVDTSAAGADYGGCGNSAGAPDVVYTFTLTDPWDVHVELDDAGSFDSIVHLQADACGAGGRTLGCIDDPEPQVIDSVVLTPGQYWVIVDGYRTASGTAALTVELRPPPIIVGDASCATPQVVPLDADGRAAMSFAGDTTGGLNEIAADCASGTHVAAEHVYQIDVVERTEIAATLVTDTLGFDSMLAVVGAGCATGTTLSCLDDPEPQELRAVLDPGTWFVVVDGWSDDVGPYRLELEAEPWVDRGPDRCDTVAPLDLDPTTLTGEVSGTTAGLPRDDFVDDDCGGAGAPDVVYLVSVPSLALATVSIDTGGAWDASIRIDDDCDTDSFGGLACVRQPAGNGFARLLDPGDYFLVVDGATASAAGDFTLRVALDVQAASGNDTCASPHELVIDPLTGDVSAFSDTTGSTDDYQSCLLHSSCVGDGAPDQVYTFTLADRSPVEVRLDDGGTFDSVLYVRTRCDDDASAVGSIDDPEPQRIGSWLDPGQYFVVVDGYSSFSGGGSYALYVSARANIPANDDCATVEPLVFDATGLASVGGDTTFATASFQGTCAFTSASRDLVYSFETTQEGAFEARLTADFDGAIYLQTACGDPTTEVACYDTLATPQVLRVDPLPAGAYFLIVDGWFSGDRGTFQLEVQVP